MTNTIPIGEMQDAVDKKLEETGSDLEVTISAADEDAQVEVDQRQSDAQDDEPESDVEGDAEQEQPKPTKSISELEHDHYEQIRAKEHDVREARLEYQDAKTVANQLKKKSDRLDEELCDLIAQDPRQHKLPFADNADDSEVDRDVAAEDLYRGESVYVLSLPVSLTEKLVDGGLGTLGELQDYWHARKQLTDLDGIGEEYAAKVADAFAEYGKQNPGMFGQVEDEEETEEADEAEESPEGEAATDEQAADEPTPEVHEPDVEPVEQTNE